MNFVTVKGKELEYVSRISDYQNNAVLSLNQTCESTVNYCVAIEITYQNINAFSELINFARGATLLNESQIAYFIEQILQGLNELHQ